MARIDEEEFREQLRRQGFSRVYVWQGAAGAFYPDHTHEGLTAHIILDGEMTLSMRANRKRTELVIAATFLRVQYMQRGWVRKAAAT
jgi:hypothetical protein